MPTDFYPLISRAIRSLDPDSPEARSAVYDRVRQMLVKQLRSMNPPVSEAEISIEKTALEDAIQRIERQAAQTHNIKDRSLSHPPNDVIAKYIRPGEKVQFTSAGAISWTPIYYRPTSGQLNQAFLRGSLGPGGRGGIPGGGAAMETMAAMPRPRQWKASKIDWIVLTNQRLLFVSKGLPERIFELDAPQIKEWIEAERDARNKASEALKDAWKNRGLLGVFGRTKSDDNEPVIPPGRCTISSAKMNWHLLRRKRKSWIGLAVLMVGVVILWQLISHGVPPRIWLVVALAILVASRIEPWTGVRLRVALLQYGTPKIVRSMSNRALSRAEIQLCTREDAERLVSLLAPRIKEISDVMSAKAK